MVRVTKTTIPFDSINIYLYKPSTAGSIAVPNNAKYYVFDTSSINTLKFLEG